MHPNYEKPFTFDRVVRIVIGTIVIIALYLLVNHIRGALIPFFVAWLIAYLMNPVVNFIQNKVKVKSRLLSVLITLILIIGVLTGLVYLLVQPISYEVEHTIALLKNYAASNHDSILFPDNWEKSFRKLIELPEIQQYIANQDYGKLFEKIMPSAWKIFSGSVNAVLSIFVVFVILLYIIFILLDFDKISTGWIKLIPDKYRHFIDKLSDDLEDGMNRYFRGQFLIATIVGVLFSIGFSIIDLPLAIVFGIFVGLLNLIPYLQIISIVPATLLILLKSLETGQPVWIVALSVLIVYAVVQTFQDGFLVPKIMGKRMGLNPAIILLSLSVWGALLGIVGMIIALPFTTLLISYYKRFILYEDEQGRSIDEVQSKPKQKKQDQATS
ncbi:AI-2E family transporter [Saccharicrinis sp. FJH54]|uniref:AI-2E family transporter n=1 Tax=Saccharicrinis sp. FJH54 TaxID=3344665 RepID=UPI0035D42E7D